MDIHHSYSDFKARVNPDCKASEGRRLDKWSSRFKGKQDSWLNMKKKSFMPNTFEKKKKKLESLEM